MCRPWNLHGDFKEILNSLLFGRKKYLAIVDWKSKIMILEMWDEMEDFVFFQKVILICQNYKWIMG